MANSIFFVVSLVAAMTTRVTADCSPSDEIGCLNGKAFNKSQEFTCGSSINNRPAIYQSATTSCCAQGIPFTKETSFCCFDGVHDRSTGSCKPWSRSFPPSCNCWSGNTRLLSEARVLVDDNVVNTSAENPQGACSGPTPTRGCLNGYLYDYSTQMPCGDYLVSVNTHGCCSTSGGIKAYNLQTQSCCELGESHEVFDGGRACSCSKCTTTTTTTSTTTTTTSTTTTTTSTTTTTTSTTSTTTTITTTTTVPILTTRMLIDVMLAPGKGADSSAFDNTTAFEEALAQVLGVDAKDAEVESVNLRVNVSYSFSANVSEAAVGAAASDVLNVSLGSVNVVLDLDAYGNTNVIVTVEAKSAKEAGEVSTKAANATEVTAALAEYGVTANTTVRNAPTQYLEVNATLESKTGTHVAAPTSGQLAQLGKDLGAGVALKSVTLEEPDSNAATSTHVTSTTNAQVGSTSRAAQFVPLSGSRQCFASWFLMAVVLSAKVLF